MVRNGGRKGGDVTGEDAFDRREKEEEKDQREQEGQTAGRADSGCQSGSWRRETTSGSGGE